MKINTSHNGAAAKSGAFTLIELLVVISIIALLASVAVPAYQTTILNAHENAAMQNARQIGIAIRAYANDYGGSYVSGTNAYGQQITTSNDAFRSLIPAYLDSENVFVVPGSVDGPSTDSITDPYTQILKPGENHFAYIEGLSETSNSEWPMIVDGANSLGEYVTDQSQPGGVWKGTKVVVINTDSSAHLIPLVGTGATRFLPQYNDPTQNALNVSYMGSNVQLLEPATN